MKICESSIQAVLMNWAMNEKNHIIVVPNSTVILPWEADLITFTRANFIHEIEIKISLADYKKDAKKIWKHMSLNGHCFQCCPNYFWYATADFEITPPSYAGWIKIIEREDKSKVQVMKDAPRLHNNKASDQQTRSAATIISHHLRWFFWQRAIKMIDEEKAKL